MSRLGRFDEYRFVGLRDSMVFYDSDDDEQFAELSELVEQGELVERNRLQSFAPDTPEEARNRGFRPVRSS